MMSESGRKKILERGRRGRRYAALHGSVNVLAKAPCGYRCHPKGECGGIAHFEVVPEPAAVVPRILEGIGHDQARVAAHAQPQDAQAKRVLDDVKQVRAAMFSAVSDMMLQIEARCKAVRAEHPVC